MSPCLPYDRLAARLAAGRRAKLDRRRIERGRRVAQGRNVQATSDADLAFHLAIYAASGNLLIEPSANLHWRHIRRAMGAVLQRSAVRAAAIGAGDVDRAESLISAHDQRASEHMTRLWPQERQRETEP